MGEFIILYNFDKVFQLGKTVNTLYNLEPHENLGDMDDPNFESKSVKLLMILLEHPEFVDTGKDTRAMSMVRILKKSPAVQVFDDILDNAIDMVDYSRIGVIGHVSSDATLDPRIVRINDEQIIHQ